MEDEVLFEQAFDFHGKHFQQIKSMVRKSSFILLHFLDFTVLLKNKYVTISNYIIQCSQLPDKSVSSLVRYYYSWKKRKSRLSLLDRQARKPTAPKETSSWLINFIQLRFCKCSY